MKYLLMITFALMLAGCSEEIPRCLREPNQKVRQEIFKECLKIASEARKGANYTTNDDEDFDEVVSECGSVAYYQSLESACGDEHERFQKVNGIKDDK